MADRVDGAYDDVCDDPFGRGAVEFTVGSNEYAIPLPDYDGGHISLSVQSSSDDHERDDQGPIT